MVQKWVALIAINPLGARSSSWAIIMCSQIHATQVIVQVVKRNQNATYVLAQHNKHIACVLPYEKNCIFIETFYYYVQVFNFIVLPHVLQRLPWLCKPKPCAQPKKGLSFYVGMRGTLIFANFLPPKPCDREKEFEIIAVI